MTYEKSFKEEAVRLSDEIGVKKAAQQMGIPYYTLADRRRSRKRYSSRAYISSGHIFSPSFTLQFGLYTEFGTLPDCLR